MSFLVRYTLNSADDHTNQVNAMQKLVADLRSEGVANVHYSCFTTEEDTQFIGILEFPDDAGKQNFLSSAAFEAYKTTVGPTFANPPQTSDIELIASTRD